MSQEEVKALHQQIYAMSHTIEALKRRCVELEFQIIDHMAHNISHEAEELLRGQAKSQLPDRDDD